MYIHRFGFFNQEEGADLILGILNKVIELSVEKPYETQIIF